MEWRLLDALFLAVRNLFLMKIKSMRRPRIAGTGNRCRLPRLFRMCTDAQKQKRLPGEFEGTKTIGNESKREKSELAGVVAGRCVQCGVRLVRQGR